MVLVSKLGLAKLRTPVNGKEVIVDQTEVCYAENLAANIIIYGILKERGVFLKRVDTRSYVVRQGDNLKIFEIICHNNVLTIDDMGEKTKMRARVVQSDIIQGYDGIIEAVTDTAVLDLH